MGSGHGNWTVLRQVVTLFSTLHQFQLSGNMLVQQPAEDTSPHNGGLGPGPWLLCHGDSAAPAFAVAWAKREDRSCRDRRCWGMLCEWGGRKPCALSSGRCCFESGCRGISASKNLLKQLSSHCQQPVLWYLSLSLQGHNYAIWIQGGWGPVCSALSGDKTWNARFREHT